MSGTGRKAVRVQTDRHGDWAAAEESRPQPEEGSDEGHRLHVEVSGDLEDDVSRGVHHDGVSLSNIRLGQEGIQDCGHWPFSKV